MPPTEPISDDEPACANGASPPAPPAGSAIELEPAGGAGIYAGEVVEIRGPQGCGKSLLCLHIAMAALQAGGECAWIDADGALQPGFALQCSPLAARMVWARPTSAEAALEMLVRLAAAGPRLIVLDSLTALTGLPDSGPAPDEPHTGEKLLSQALRLTLPQLLHHGSSLVFTRLELPLGGFSAAYHQLSRSLERLAPGLHARLTIRLEAIRPLRGGGETIGQRLQARLTRRGIPHSGENFMSISPCSQRIDFDIMYKQRIIQTGEVFDPGG